METLVRILIIDDDTVFVKRLRDLVAHPQVVIDTATTVPEDIFYHFYILGGSVEITEAVDKIRTHNEGNPIYLSGAVCNKNVPVRKMVKCNIVDCLEDEQAMRSFVKKVSSFCKQKAKMRKASFKLDYLKTGDLESLARALKKTESDRFIDYIQNHSLPMVLVSRDYDVLHANSAMEEMIGTRLAGVSAATYYVDPSQLDALVFDLKEKGELLGRTVTLKNIHGDQFDMKLYSSLHNDADGNWLNTRCLFVPIDPE